MPLVTLAEAQEHLRDTRPSAAAEIQRKLDAAILLATSYLNCNVYADQVALDAAIAAVPAGLDAAVVTYDAAVLAVDALTSGIAQDAAREQADRVLAAAQHAARRTYNGVVINECIRAGILLILGHLWENRQDVQTMVSGGAIPQGSQDVLQPYRAGMGV